jgi:uncharacterized protein YbdZ (MbtH family)
MNHLKFLFRLLTGRLEILPRVQWITAQHQGNFSLWHGRESNIPPGYACVMKHASYEAMVRWLGNEVAT